ncbi:MAG: type II toxin-antitoxin system HipA family toxin [Alphaproteobacteria bacterium]|nr:type II toxin-antitoxin system HipA family toxin [Alphaproteobacteria bacterium]
MMADVSVLDVLLYGEPIGTLTRVGGDRSLFAFNDAYIADEARPVLGLGFKDSLGELITDFKPTQTRVPPFFSNLLPEGHMRTYLAERAGVNPVREFFLLWALGKDLPGAIAIRPTDGEAWPPDADADADDNRDDNHRENALRFSLAGVQLKFSAIEQARGGLTIPAEGVGGSWIVKLPSREFAGVPENEFSMMTLARLIGMDVPAIQLVDIDMIGNLPEGIGALSGQALAIERFDRLQGGATVHTEDFAQIFGVYPEEKYKRASARNIGAVIAAEGGEADIVEFIRRLTFNTLIGNADMHLKNWSIIYPDRRNAALAPAYDFVSTIPYIPDRKAALNFSRTRRFDEYSEDELTHLAARALLPKKLVLDTARETVALFHQHWRAEKTNLPLMAKVVEAIDAHLKTIPIA